MCVHTLRKISESPFQLAKMQDSSADVEVCNATRPTKVAAAAAALDVKEVPELEEFWSDKVHERDLCETKWPRCLADLTVKWLSAFLQSDVEDFKSVTVGTNETTETARIRLQHRNAFLQSTKTCSLMAVFPSSRGSVRRMWQPTYRGMVAAHQHFAARNPTALPPLAVNYNPDQPRHFSILYEDPITSAAAVAAAAAAANPLGEEIIRFDDWAARGMNLRVAHLMYAAVAETHAVFFADPTVERQLRATSSAAEPAAASGGTESASSSGQGRFAPGFGAALRAFFEPGPLLQLLGPNERAWSGKSVREVYATLAEVARLPSARASGSSDSTGGGGGGGSGGMSQHPVPSLYGPRGRAIVQRCLEIFSSRPLTLCHGELHPGHAYLNTATNGFRFASWRLACAAPPGMDLGVGILTALQPCTQAQIRGVVQNYYDALVSHGADVAGTYSFEDCWTDMLIGCVLWCCLYPLMEVERLLGAAQAAHRPGSAAPSSGARPQSAAVLSPTASSSSSLSPPPTTTSASTPWLAREAALIHPDFGDASREPTRRYLPATHARMLRNAAELNLDAFAQSLLPAGTASNSSNGATSSSSWSAGADAAASEPVDQENAKPASQQEDPTTSPSSGGDKKLATAPRLRAEVPFT
jgi:hypothetical protein